MVNPMHGEHEDGLHESAMHEEHDSIMRNFIESGKQWVWTKDFGICSGSHCQIGNNFPFLHKGKIRDGKAAIDRWKVDDEKAPPSFEFRDDFIAKTIHDTDEEKVRDKMIREVQAMKDLRHPHIAAFLGTWEHLGRLSVLMFPVACCDLQRFMTEIDAELQKLRNQSALEGCSLSDLAPINASGNMKEKKKLNVSKNNRTSPLELPWLQKLMMIRGFFPCLCQALSYIHKLGVRHKDIKPENILVDQSGSIIVADFGISRVFPLNEPHDTNDEPKFSWKYASPEMIERTVLRGDPSDVYSLGCVFLEMATLVFGESFRNLTDHYVVSGNEIKRAEDYHLNLDGVYSWIEHLRSLRTESKKLRGYEVNQRASSLSPISMHEDQQMVDSCLCIRNMLSRNPDDRPKSNELCQYFASVALQPCRDCDSRHPNVWKESAQQKERAKRSSGTRHSIGVISAAGFFEDDEGLLNPGANDDDVDSAQATLKGSNHSHGRDSFPIRSKVGTMEHTIAQYQAFEPSDSDYIPMASTQTDTDMRRLDTPISTGSLHGLVHQLSREVDNHSVTPSAGPSPNIPFQLMHTPAPNERLHTTARFRKPPSLEEMVEKCDARAADLEDGRWATPDHPTLDQLRKTPQTTTVAGMESSNSDIVNRVTKVMIYDFGKKIPYIAPFLTIEGLSALCISL